MPSARCCGTSVGVIARNEAGDLLMIERGWYPAGIAPVAGHVRDAHDNPEAAAVAEMAEETGLTVTGHEQVWEGWRPNLCASPPAVIPGHYWWLATATVTGDLNPDPVETKGAAWYSPAEVAELAARTLLWATGTVQDGEFDLRPGLEPVWVEHLYTVGMLDLPPEGRKLIRRLYTTPPDDYWLAGGLVPAAALAAYSESD